ncbi:metallo-dependent hydrolase superfamily protein KNAG_0B05270 [Huiozyma naganishii CBS 8797]|uniref:Uncharacterized protein n=1 Tax=Huiozyma naganishii (strain ATCC MYA-139 / BCRC 22969 / CBS 8797 / KCTC 17520 / NBRC 10181 / NCYC 3082 / Yp74L-3) TaxID=1071383 RepID=J7R2E0_HUIN7|nr:hypothetical protein KNAG_0B05270 [Kazachstania naganishii CBS 8797]CCK68960.1 hypothetical protein KNAG_0B05270 [Kazachstania naganishii CBS 8797]
MTVGSVTDQRSLFSEENGMSDVAVKTMPLASTEATEQLQKKKDISIDDMDMIALKTNFDKQMIVGSPMYLDPLEEERGTMILEYKDDEIRKESRYSLKGNCSNPEPASSTHYHFQKIREVTNPFHQLVKFREKYVRGSFQDSESNIKNDVEKWLVYPKPLPKFWKFDKDERFLGEAEFDPENPIRKVKSGYYCIRPHDYGLANRTAASSIHYTGEEFELDDFVSTIAEHNKVHSLDEDDLEEREIPTFREFKHNFGFMIEMIQSHPMNEISEKRLNYLLDKFDLFQHLKSKSEILENKQVPYRDFYNCRKVDQGVLLSGLVTQRQLSEFIWEKINTESTRIVHVTSSGDGLTIRDIFQLGCSHENPLEVGLKVIDDQFLDWYRDVYLSTYHLIKYSESEIENELSGLKLRYYFLAKIFLEFDNAIEGEYLAQILIRFTIHLLEKSKYQLGQISVDFQFYDPKDSNAQTNNWWMKFSHWLIKWKLVSYNIRWNIQLSRVFPQLFAARKVSNFQDYFDSIFTPLFENQESKELDFFLRNVCSLDVVISQSDEYLWKIFADINLPPKDWVAEGDNPTISHYIYYTFANLARFNQLRHRKHKNTIPLRSYCSPSTSNRTSQFSSTTLYFTEKVESLVCNLLLCNGGLLQGEPIWNAPSLLEYLFYLFQIPIITAPLSSVNVSSGNTDALLNDQKGTLKQSNGPEANPVKLSRDISVAGQYTYDKNPFMKMLRIGFKVCISSRSVLFNSSYTLEPMIEEYSVAASIYLLNAADLCELARNSVISSGYNGFYKAHWSGIVIENNGDNVMSDPLGLIDMWNDKPEDNRIRHNVPNIRRKYRTETLEQEWEFINDRFVD